ncbi:hypothetical protein QEH56_13170 [Pelagicoccus enzymogenes]|uniref:hypothetical protein n=1 Tax=Pelagicoccus enzymogenes TaxID=2773457 RepID=UPI002810320E|nr:hypothetical protein [Pelagicoccus enzymogenes]MDQ8199112.1 hypothetical protein [Pelagicoccus enzymogenes]
MAVVLFVFRDTVLSGFDRVPGDKLDGRLIMLLHEHWFRFFEGSADWLEVGMFYPVENTLGLSDTFFLSGSLHAVFRFLGLDVYGAYFAQFVVLAIIGYSSVYWLLTRYVELGPWISIGLSSLFMVFSPVNVGAEYSHIQMYSVWWLPFFFCILLVGLKKDLRAIWRFALGVVAGALYAALLYNAFYVPWFLALFGALFIGCWIGFRIYESRNCPRWALEFLSGLWKRQRFWFIGFCLGFATAIVPFLLTYLPVLEYSSGHGFGLVFESLPRLTDWFHFGSFSYLWSSLGGELFDTSNQPNKGYGFPLLTGVLTLLTVGYALFFYRSDEEGFRSRIVVRSLALSLLLSWLLQLRICEGSLWWFVYQLVPGGSVVRVVFRFNAVLCLPLLCLWGILLAGVVNGLRSRPVSIGFNSVSKASLLLVFVGLVYAEQTLEENVSETNRWALRRSDWVDLKRQSKEPPDGTEAFVMLTKSSLTSHQDLSLQLDAWSLAQEWKLSTINGRSGIVPKGYKLFNSLSGGGIDRFWSALRDWVSRSELERGLMVVDRDTWDWARYGDVLNQRIPVYELGTSISFAGEQRGPDELNVYQIMDFGWSGVEPTHTWTDGDSSAITLRLSEKPDRDMTLVLEAFAYVSPNVAQQRFGILANERFLGELTIGHHFPARRYELGIPADSLSGRLLRIEIRSADAISPIKADGVDDRRQLGMGLRSLSISPKLDTSH